MSRGKKKMVQAIFFYFYDKIKIWRCLKMYINKNTDKEPLVKVKPPTTALKKMIIENLPEMNREYKDRLYKRIVSVAKGEK